MLSSGKHWTALLNLVTSFGVGTVGDMPGAYYCPNPLKERKECLNSAITDIDIFVRSNLLNYGKNKRAFS
jgi:hypothetical protein